VQGFNWLLSHALNYVWMYMVWSKQCIIGIRVSIYKWVFVSALHTSEYQCTSMFLTRKIMATKRNHLGFSQSAMLYGQTNTPWVVPLLAMITLNHITSRKTRTAFIHTLTSTCTVVHINLCTIHVVHLVRFKFGEFVLNHQITLIYSQI